jgi:hypothetical protein
MRASLTQLSNPLAYQSGGIILHYSNKGNINRSAAEIKFAFGRAAAGRTSFALRTPRTKETLSMSDRSLRPSVPWAVSHGMTLSPQQRRNRKNNQTYFQWELNYLKIYINFFLLFVRKPITLLEVISFQGNRSKM